VDGHAYAYRAFHAIRALSAPDGSPTNAVFGFIKMLQKLDASLKPSHRLVLWDAGLAEERTALLPGYKSERPPTPENLAIQLPQLADWLTAAGWSQWEVEGTEADDWIGTYTRRATAAGWRVVIASADKDFLQLVSDSVALSNPNDKTEKLWTAADVVAKTGVRPEQIVDWLSLVGDNVDEIPGIAGVGPKTAAELLQKHGTIDAILARAGELKSERLRVGLQAGGELLRRNQKLVALNCDLPGGPELPTLVPGALDLPRLKNLYLGWGFRSLHAEVAGLVGSVPDPGTTPASGPSLTQGSLF
jgi:DNA polymerase-1